MLRGWPALVVMVILVFAFFDALFTNNLETAKAIGISLVVSAILSALRLLYSWYRAR